MNSRQLILSNKGYSFVSILISLAIVGILAAVSLSYYNSLGFLNKDISESGSVTGRLSRTLAIESLEKLHALELNYQIQHGKFATFDELQKSGAIPEGYTAGLEEQGVPYLEYWDLNIKAEENSYLLLAIPNDKTVDFDYVPILGMNETGKIWEEEGLDGYDTDWLDTSDETEEEVPFFLPDPGSDSR